MKDLAITIMREHMEDIFDMPIPERFGIRSYHTGEGHNWTCGQEATEPSIEL